MLLIALLGCKPLPPAPAEEPTSPEECFQAIQRGLSIAEPGALIEEILRGSGLAAPPGGYRRGEDHLGLLTGAGSLEDEVALLSAGTPSGTAAMLCAAGALRERLEGEYPRRTVVVAALADPEGQWRYLEDPPLPLEDTTAAVYLGEVGGELAVRGLGSAREWPDWLRAAGALELRPAPLTPAPFAEPGIPWLSFSSEPGALPEEGAQMVTLLTGLLEILVLSPSPPSPARE